MHKKYAIYIVWTPEPYYIVLSTKGGNTMHAVLTYDTRISEIIEHPNTTYDTHAQYHVP